MRKRIINCAIFLFLIISLPKFLFAQDSNFYPGNLINNLKGYFLTYYHQIEEKHIIIPKGQVLKDLKKIAAQYSEIDKEQILNAHDFIDLNSLFDKHLRGYGKSISIFAVNGSGIVNCWLGDLVEAKRERRNIWGKEIDFTVKVMDNLKIRDFTYFLSKGRESLDVGTRGGIIFYNLEAYKMRAASIWNFFADREDGKKDKRYDSSKSNRLRKWLYYKTWSDLYMECIKDSRDSAEARIEFIDQAVGLLKENSLFHEIGHIFTGKHLKLNDESEEEIIAFLSELRYGSLPHESLETIIAAGYKSSIDGYNSAGSYLIDGFISYIKDEQKIKNPKYKNINIQGRNWIEKSNNLYKLNEEQIRAISGNMFDKITQGGAINGKDFNY